MTAHGYKYDPNDLMFKSTSDVVKMASVCMLAAILCGLTGIAGGMVLGPLFLSYNMLPVIVSATNQYITMIASVAVVIQFYVLNMLNIPYSIIFGAITIVAAYLGINAVNKFVAKSGRQSIIPILLTSILVFAVLSLPLNYVLKGMKKQEVSQ